MATIIFDFDGTIADSFDYVATSWRAMSGAAIL
jgi:phosphoglycolate phosphatase-like HAD superfamily hydrolase